jgi:ubiquinone/menaquinone biosynthesis C-methylase UbiE
MDQATNSQQYILGHSDAELARLEHQAQIFGAETREVLRRAGVAPGMRVLDIGCGVGDVSLIAADMVGPSGRVLGIDNAGAALPTARARAARGGYGWLDFEEANIYAYRTSEAFDAVIGRFILMHVPDPVAVVKAAIRFSKPTGIIAFIEMDISESSTLPELPLMTRCVDWIVQTYRKVGVEPNMGSQLHATFRAAGLDPLLHGTCRIEGGANAIAYDFAAQALQTLLPAIEAYGIATAAEVDPPTLAARLREAAVAGDHCMFLPRLVGAWATMR